MAASPGGAHLDALRGRHDAAQGRLAPLRSDATSVLYDAGGMLIARTEVVNQVAAMTSGAARPSVLSSCSGHSSMRSSEARSVHSAARRSSWPPEPPPTSLNATRGQASGATIAAARSCEGFASVHPRTCSRRPAAQTGPRRARPGGAETARLAGSTALPLWTRAAAEWDKIDRPHDAAYCRWRGAQEALTRGERRTAQRMLRRAVQQAGEHLPLATAISETVTRAAQTRQRG